MQYQGVIIEESIKKGDILKKLKIIDTKVETVTERHQTPHLKRWTLHTVEISEEQARDIAEKIEKVILDKWYADYKNDSIHYIIFRNKIFCIDRSSLEQYEEASKYGISIGIPNYQVGFVKNVIAV